VHTVLEAQESGTISFLISRVVPGLAPGEEVATGEIYCQGTAELDAQTAMQSLDLLTVQARCQHQISAAECYQRYRSQGISHGPAFQGVEQMSVGDGEALARLRLPAIVVQTRKEGDVDCRETDGGKLRPYVLHPGMLDAALQACIGLLREPVEHQKTQERLLQTSVPFALEELLIVSEMPAQGWAWVRLRSHSTWMGTGPVPPSVFDIEVCDDAGHIALHLHGLSIRPLPTEKEASTLLLTPGWKEEAVGRQSLAEETPSSAVGTGPCVCSLTPVAAPLVLLCDLPGIEASRLQAQLIEGGRCLSLRSIQFRRDHRFRDAVVQLIQELQHLQQSRSADGGKGLAPFLVQVVVAHREEPSFLEALVGVLKWGQQEYPKLRGQIIEVDGEPEEEELLT